jgi:hypothetical protein
VLYCIHPYIRDVSLSVALYLYSYSHGYASTVSPWILSTHLNVPMSVYHARPPCKFMTTYTHSLHVYLQYMFVQSFLTPWVRTVIPLLLVCPCDFGLLYRMCLFWQSMHSAYAVVHSDQRVYTVLMFLCIHRCIFSCMCMSSSMIRTVYMYIGTLDCQWRRHYYTYSM